MHSRLGHTGVKRAAGAQQQDSPQQEQQQEQPQAQPLSDRAWWELAVRAAHVALQRWRGYLQLQPQPQPQPGPGRGATPPTTSAASVNAAASKAGGVSRSSIDGRGGGSVGPSGSAARTAKPLTQKQLRQHAAAAAKQQQAASKQASKQAAATAKQRREEKRREVAEAVAAARREARLKAYRQGGIAQRACSGLAFQSLCVALPTALLTALQGAGGNGPAEEKAAQLLHSLYNYWPQQPHPGQPPPPQAPPRAASAAAALIAAGSRPQQAPKLKQQGPAAVSASGVEHMVLEAAPRRQAAAFIVSAAKLTRAMMASAGKQVGAAGGRSAHDIAAAGAAYVSKQRVPLSVLRSMRAGSTGCGRDRGCAAAGDSGGTSEPAASEPHRVELVSLLASTWLATAADNWAIALNSNSGSGGAVGAAVMPLALSVLEWVPALVLAHTHALERGDAQAAKEMASFILYDLMPFQSINFVATTRELSSIEKACVLRAAEALWAALITNDAVERNSGRICQGLLKRTGCWQGGLGRLEQLWATGEAATAARAAVLAELRAGGGGNGSAPESPAAVAAAAAAVEDVALLLTPSEVRRRLGLCANRGCPNLVGDSEAGQELPVACQVCGAAGRYCGGEDCCVFLRGHWEEEELQMLACC
ncbi:hypothetical protein HYH02_004791 [Chlamydomonas schloesseri]|uniref:Uncharacterized protein n=1 Tax=Chlamydomonas schloesseri TaxID=2026947 RepID=A0A835WMD0_9CHLO|nr:hypothetical protein HYH02_004791 [Chlamydomonas schloesseri]|eukprot:KAG2450282.1 hypothetical protein HYH02_004791 [Chlamydomonas schloesseri]